MAAEVPDALADEDFKTDVDTKAASGKRNPGGVISDLWITSATKMKLAADSRTPATEINVDTTGGVVGLLGGDHAEQGKSAASEIARGVHGVKRVENEIEVVSSARQEMVQARQENADIG